MIKGARARAAEGGPGARRSRRVWDGAGNGVLVQPAPERLVGVEVAQRPRLRRDLRRWRRKAAPLPGAASGWAQSLKGLCVAPLEALANGATAFLTVS